MKFFVSLLLVILIGLCNPPDAHPQSLTIPDSVLSQGQSQRVLTFSVETIPDGVVVAASYFRFRYDPSVIRIDSVFANQSDWLIVDRKSSPGVIEIALLTPKRKATEGPFFSWVVTPVGVGMSGLTMTDLSWTDCNDIEILPERIIPTDPHPVVVEEMYEGDVYWVDSVFGDDNNGNCTSFDTPCKSTTPFQYDLLPGDAVVFMPGIHRISVFPVRSGSPDLPITYTSYPNSDEPVIITGADPFNTAWSNNGDGTWSTPYNQSLPEHPSNANPQVQWRPEVLVVEGEFFRTVYNRSDVTTNTFFVQGPSNNPSEIVGNFGGRNPNEIDIEYGTRDSLFVAPNNVDYIHVSNLVFRHAPNSFAKLGCLDIRGNMWVVVDVLVEWCNTTGIRFFGNGHQFVRTEASYNGVVGWNAEGATNVDVYDGVATGNNVKGFDPNWHAGGAKITHGSSRIRWIRFKAYYNDGPGLWYDIPWGERNEITGGEFVGNVLAGIFLEHGTIYTLVSDNLIYGTRVFPGNGVGAGMRLQAAASNIITHNTIYGNEGSGIFEKFRDRRSPPGYNVFTNNIIGYNATGPGTDYEIQIDRDANERVVDFFQNNLFVLQPVNSPDKTFRSQNSYTGNDVEMWRLNQIHLEPYDFALTRGNLVLENPNDPEGWRSLIDGYGKRF